MLQVLKNCFTNSTEGILMDKSKIISSMTLRQKADFLTGKNFWQTLDLPALGVPSIFLSDGPHGLRRQAAKADHLGLNASIPATCFPELPKARDWQELKDALAVRDIDMKFKVSRTTQEVQGVKFEYNGFSFSGSKISREFSFLNINRRLERNTLSPSLECPRQESEHKDEDLAPGISQFDRGVSFGLGLFIGDSSYDATAAEEAEFRRLMKKKKAKRKRGFHL